MSLHTVQPLVRAYVLDERGVEVSSNELLEWLTSNATDDEFSRFVEENATRSGIDPTSVPEMIGKMV